MKLNQANSVLYGYTPPCMPDIVNLALTYDKIYDYDKSLESLRTEARILAQHFSGGKLAFEDVKGWNFPGVFLLIDSVAKYHGFDILNVLDSRLVENVLRLDNAKSNRKIDCERFIKIIDSCFQLVSKHAPVVAEKLISTLASLHRLFDEGIIIPHQSLIPEIKRARRATINMASDAAERDMQDEGFLSLVSWMDDKDNQWWVSFTLNAQLLESSYLGIPLHLWDNDLPLVEYKYQRGARYLPKLRKTEVIREAFSVLTPEVYTLDVSDLLKVRNSSEFSSFRKEVNRVYREVIKAPQDFPDSNALSEYFRSNYFSQLEHLALERCPKPGTVLLRKLVAEVHPL